MLPDQHLTATIVVCCVNGGDACTYNTTTAAQDQHCQHPCISTRTHMHIHAYAATLFWCLMVASAAATGRWCRAACLPPGLVPPPSQNTLPPYQLCRMRPGPPLLLHHWSCQTVHHPCAGSGSREEGIGQESVKKGAWQHRVIDTSAGANTS